MAKKKIKLKKAGDGKNIRGGTFWGHRKSENDSDLENAFEYIPVIGNLASVNDWMDATQSLVQNPSWNNLGKATLETAGLIPFGKAFTSGLKSGKLLNKAERTGLFLESALNYASDENAPSIFSSNGKIEKKANGGRAPIKGTKEQYQAYQDSLDLYTANRDRLVQLERESRYATNMFGQSGLYNNGLLSEHYTYLPPHRVTHNQYSLTNVPSNYENGNDRTYWGFENRRSNVTINPITYHGFDRRFRQNVIRGTNQTVNLPGQNDLHEYAGIWQFPQPVQPIIYQPEATYRPVQSQGIVTNSLGQSFPRVLSNQQEQPINIQSAKPDLLQGNNQQLEFNPIGFQKGSYFTRPQQGQETGGLEYFDKKTGHKLMGEGGKFTDPRQDSYYTPSSSDKKDLKKVYNENIQKQNDLRLIQSLQEKSKQRYEPNQYVKNTKAALSVGQLTQPFNLPLKAIATGADLETSLKYALDGQYKNAGEDLIQAGINWIPFLNQQKMINLSKNTPSLAYQFNQLIPQINQGINYLQKGNDVKTTTEAFEFGGNIQINNTNELDMAKNGKKIKMKLKKADIGKFIPTSDGNTYNEFGIEEDPQSLQETQYDPITGEKLTNNYNQFNPSLTYGLQNYYQSKNKKAPAYLSAEEGSQYADYIAQQPQQPNWGQNNNSTFTPHNSVSGLSQNFQKIGSGAQKMAKGDWKGAISDWGGTEFELAKGFSNIAVAQKTNRRLEENQADLLKQSLTQPYLNDYSDNQFGYSKVPLSKYGIKLPKANYGIPSKFEGKTHAEGGEPINTNMQFNNANDLKTPRHLANLEVETDEYLLPQAELGTQEPSMGVLSAKKRVGFTMKAKNGKNIKVSPSEAVDEMAKIEGIPTPDKMNKYISKREKFIKDNKNFAPSDTQNAIDILLPQYKAKIDPITNLAFNLQEQRKEELGISDAPQAKFGRLMKMDIGGGLSKEEENYIKSYKFGNKDPKVSEIAKKLRANKQLAQMWEKSGAPGGYEGFPGLTDEELLSSLAEDKRLIGAFDLSSQQPVINNSANNSTFNYNIQPDKRKLDPTYSKMRQQTTPTGVKYEPLTAQDIADWKGIESNLNLAHPNGIPFTDNTLGYYKDAKGNPITDKQQLTNLGYQEQYYDDMLETPEGRQELAKMWQEKGKTLKGIKLPTKTDDLTSLGDQELYDRLNSLRPAYLDSYPKVRKGSKYYNPNPTATSKATPKVLREASKPSTIAEYNGVKGNNTNQGNNIIPVVNPFQEPYLESPVTRFKFNPNLIDYRKQNPDFTEIDRQYQGALTGDPRTDANLFKQGLLAKNQLTSQAFNQNQQGMQQVDQYNAGALDRNQQLQYGENAQYRNLVDQMRGNLNTQKLMDLKTNQGNFQKQYDYYNSIPELERLYGANPDNSLITPSFNQMAGITAPKTKTRKFGGKIKMKLPTKKKTSSK